MYLLDADVFIRSNNDHYAPEFGNGFWDWIVLKNREGVIFSAEKILNDVLKKEDQLNQWAQDAGRGLFISESSELVQELGTVFQWVAAQERFTPQARNTFFACSDPYLIAQAIVSGYTVVTYETRAPESKANVKIPDVCDGVGVRPIGPFDMLREMGARFIDLPR